MNFDGHNINLKVDTGSSETYLVYGGWYESLYGRGSCKDLISGCYFCPPTDPCDLDTLLAQKIEELEYIDGDVVSYVNRNVTINFGERKISKFQIGLMVGCSRVDKDIQPYALLGLSSSLPQEPHAQVKTPSFIKQLVDAGEISHSTISIHVSKLSRGLSGQLVLGESMPQSKDTTLLPLREASYYDDTLGVVVSAVWVRSPSSSSPMMELPEVGLSVGIDTGADVTTVPEKLFSMLWEAIEKEFGRERVDGTRMVTSQPTDGKTDAIIDHHDQFWCRKSVAKRLPVIIIQVDVKSTLEVHLSNHVNVCDGEWCMLSVIDRVHPNEPFDALILGGPFFIDHDVSIDFDDGVVGIRTRSRPAANKIISMRKWNKFRTPLCRRRVQHRSGVAGLIERCLGRPEDD
ncbi:hypothetical protein FOZ61_007165 [Perkinsus olseni]|uniref:Peptidase A1 domain-containing protein n=1 Tax=Perkinsus olseni TaxID=32597 RepID=A0A7J6LA76_PEROL|nr:hypothetical protein FOZ61_007165 [Perkinsus olseni]